MKTYYIEIERQGNTLAVVKVEAENYDEAELKALEAIHTGDVISEISEEDARDRLSSGAVDFVLDAYGDEVDMPKPVRNTLGKAEWDKLPYYQRAWRLSLIMKNMNNEEAYFGGWIYIWPDGETYEQCMRDFGDKESYEELEESFIAHYSDEEYHNDGLCTFCGDVPEEVIKDAHMWDEALGLSPIKVL